MASFCLLWHCGLRISEACSLRVDELDLEGRKLFIRNSKEGKDRVVYMSDTAAMSLRRQLERRSDRNSVHLFPTRLDTTMLYAEVADPLLQKDYYQGISALDPASSRLALPGAQQSLLKKMEQLVEELKTPDLAPERKQEIAEQMQLLLDQIL